MTPRFRSCEHTWLGQGVTRASQPTPLAYEPMSHTNVHSMLYKHIACPVGNATQSLLVTACIVCHAANFALNETIFDWLLAIISSFDLKRSEDC